MSEAALRRETLGAGMPCLRLGSGPPLVFLPGLSARHSPPRGMELRSQAGQMRRLAARREVWWIGRRAGLAPDVTMADLAGDYAGVLRARFDGPVDVLGSSTGGSVALQLAADHPGVVRRLVVVSAAYRLGPLGRRAQWETAERLRAGRPRRAAGALLAVMGAGPVSRRVLGALGLVLGTVVTGDGDPDMLATIAAEDAFDLRDRLGEIRAPTLVIGGGRDAVHTADLFRETAALIPHGRLILYRGKGHLGTQTGRRWAEDALAFLDDRAQRNRGFRPAPFRTR